MRIGIAVFLSLAFFCNDLVYAGTFRQHQNKKNIARVIDDAASEEGADGTSGIKKESEATNFSCLLTGDSGCRKTLDCCGAGDGVFCVDSTCVKKE